MNVTHINAVDKSRFYHLLSTDGKVALVAPVSRDGVPIADAHDILLADLVRVKEVEGLFGRPKLVSKVEFQNRWAAVVNELYWLTETTAEYEEVKAMKARVHELAGAKFEAIKG